MFGHVMLGSNDIERSKRFYDAVLGVLGAGEPLRNLAYVRDPDGNKLCALHRPKISFSSTSALARLSRSGGVIPGPRLL